MQSQHAAYNCRTTFAALVLLCSLRAQAQVVFNVDSTLDEVDSNINDGICQTAAGTCTLRAAIMQANPLSGVGATIVLPAGNFLLSRDSGLGNEDSWGDLDLEPPPVLGAGSPSITIRGASATLTTIDASRRFRVLQVKPGREAAISDLTIRGGFSPTQQGGGIFNSGFLTIMRSRITDNEGLVGGAVYNDRVLFVLDSTISRNRAEFGGGLLNDSIMTIDRSTVAENIASEFKIDFGGGGVYSNGQTTIRNSLISNNSARSNGGGISYNSAFQSTLTNTTVAGNLANTNGGGVYVALGTVNLNNVSVISNDADHDRDQAGGIGGGVFVVPGAVLGLRNSLIAENTVLGFFDDDCKGVLTGYGRNMLRTTQGCSSNLAALSLITGASVGPLQNNGGPTLTHALLAGSQAIDASLTSDPCQDQNGLLSTDQRGLPRVVGVRCDIGAFEYALDPIFNSGFE